MSHWVRGCPLIDDSGNRRAMAAALRADDPNTAIEMGLLTYIASFERANIDIGKICEECAGDERIVLAAREERLRALAARERFLAREARLAKRAQAKAQKRAAASNPKTVAEAGKPASALPPAAAAALARAKAKAAGRA